MNYFSHIQILHFDHLVYFEYLDSNDMILEFGCILKKKKRGSLTLLDIFNPLKNVGRNSRNIRLLYRKKDEDYYRGNFQSLATYEEKRMLQRTVAEIERNYLTTYERIKKHAVDLSGISAQKKVKCIEVDQDVDMIIA